MWPLLKLVRLVLQVNTTYGVDPKDFINKWIAQRAADASSLNKPLIIEEFGKQLQEFTAANIAAVRDPVFADIYAALQNLDIVKGQSASHVLRLACYIHPIPCCCMETGQLEVVTVFGLLTRASCKALIAVQGFKPQQLHNFGHLLAPCCNSPFLYGMHMLQLFHFLFYMHMLLHAHVAAALRCCLLH